VMRGENRFSEKIMLHRMVQAQLPIPSLNGYVLCTLRCRPAVSG
jgi:hypothetical protein